MSKKNHHKRNFYNSSRNNTFMIQRGASQNSQIMLSISILVSGREETTEKCIASLDHLRGTVPCELILTDTGCPAGMQEWLQQKADKVLKFRWCNDFAGFVAMAQQIWPGNVIVPQKQAAGLCACGPGMVSFVELSGGRKLFYLPVPFLDVSATYIRKLWLCGEDVDFLLPGQAIALLDRERKAVEACWRGNY